MIDKPNTSSRTASYKSLLELNNYFNFIMANAIRTNMYPTVVMIRMIEDTSYTNQTSLSNQSTELEDLQAPFVMTNIDNFLVNHLRDSDLLAQTDNNDKVFVLMNSGKQEANAFVKRLLNAWDTGSYSDVKINFATCILEVKKKVSLDEIIQAGINVLDQFTHLDPSEPQVCDLFTRQEYEKVKISLIGDNETFQYFTKMKLENMQIDYVNLEIKVFSDGYDFLQSDWYKSSHKHVVILSDIMSKMNGYDVLYALRNEPNGRRYRILMMTERVVGDSVLTAYAGGLDDFINKPFQMEMLEAKIKRLIERYYR